MGALAGFAFLALGAGVVQADDNLDAGREHHRAGRVEQAVVAYTAVIDSDASDADRATARNNRCLIHINQSRLDQALADCREALTLRRRIGDEARAARTLNNLALVFERRGDFDAAATYYRQALAINDALQDVGSLVVNHGNLGVLATQTGDLAGALGHYDHVERLAAANADAAWAPRERLLARMNRAVVLERVGAFDEALTLLDYVREHVERDAPDLAGDVLLNRGVVLRNLGDPHGALDSYRQARELLAARADTAALAFLQINRAIVHMRDLDQSPRAVELLRTVLDDPANADEFGVVLAARYYLLRALLAVGELEQAQALLPALADGSGAADHAWLAADAAARVARASGALDVAVDEALAAIRSIEADRVRLSGDRLRELFLAERRQTYALAVALLYAQIEAQGDAGGAALALSIAMRAKAHALLDALGGERLPAADDALAALKSRLGERLLLEFFIAGDEIYVWSVSAQGLRMAAVDNAQKTLTQARRLRADLASGGGADAALIASLSTRLLADLPAATPLVIAPHGALRGIPFELLSDPQRGGPLVGERVISYVPTGLLWRLREPLPQPARQFVAFTRPQVAVGKNDGARHPIARSLPDLPHTAQEIAAIREMLGGEQAVFAEAAATESALHGLSASASEVLHIASHALLDGSLADGSVLVLGAGGGHDGLVFARELAQLDLPTQLTVLSACSTGRAARDAAPPIELLSGALLSSGSRAVVATLWDVADEPTAEFMRRFYARLLEGDAPATALQRVKNALRREAKWSAPGNWAAYVIVGDSVTLRLTPAARGVNLYAALATLALALAIGVALVRRINRTMR